MVCRQSNALPLFCTVGGSFKTTVDLQQDHRGTQGAMGLTPQLHLKRKLSVFSARLKGQSSPPPAH